MTVQFKDSALFLPASLDTLVHQLNKEDLYYSKKLLLENQQFSDISIDQILRKGVFPYEYFDSPIRCNETSLPPIHEFTDNLNKKTCSPDDYNHALNAWKIFQCKTFEDYLLIYLKLDVLQLADIFETFRTIALEQDGLDPAHYLTIPSFSWDSALKMTQCKINLLSDLDMHQFFDKGLRGGMTFVNTHYAKINSPIDPGTYNPSEPTTELLYVDANNLYGRALSMPLPLRDFKWLSPEEISNLDIASLDLESGDKGYVFEVDLIYPNNVQDRTEDLPFAPESGIPSSKCFTEYMNNLYSILYPGKAYQASKKLLLTHSNKQNYVVHGLLLQFYMKHGLIVDKVHRAISFYQEAFLKPYIDFNSLKRQQTNSAIEKDYFKLKNNSVYGKTIEQVLKRINLKLVVNEFKLRKLTTLPSFKRTTIYNEDLVGVHFCANNVLLDKPIFIGQAVLDLSKLFMYRWRYEIFARYEKDFNAKIRILGGDTDSFFLSVQNVSVYETLLPKMKEDGYLDTSNYPSTHPLFSLDFKANLKCIKDESGGLPFKEFVFLKPKCYSLKFLKEDTNEVKKAKGVRRVTLDKDVNFTDYYDIYKLLQKELSKWQSRIASKKHTISTLNYNKKVLSIWEDKRSWLTENFSLPYGNYRLENKTLPSKVNMPKLSLPQRNDILCEYNNAADIINDSEKDDDECV